MNKETYQEKLAATVMTDANTLGEAKEAQKIKNALTRFWKKAALAKIHKDTGRDLMAERVHWKDVRFNFDLKPTGKVTVEQWLCDDYAPPVLGERFVIPKKDLFAR
jgi:hypothetical protein